jgi:hypothetical protein
VSKPKRKPAKAEVSDHRMMLVFMGRPSRVYCWEERSAVAAWAQGG